MGEDRTIRIRSALLARSGGGGNLECPGDTCLFTDPTDQVNDPTPADASTPYVAIGNSLTAGVQSGGLVDKFQNVSFPALIAESARLGAFEMPLVSEPGIPPRYVATCP